MNTYLYFNYRKEDYYLRPSSDSRDSPGDNPPPLYYVDGNILGENAAKCSAVLAPMSELEVDDYGGRKKNKKGKKKRKEKKEKRTKSSRENDVTEDYQDESVLPKVRLVTSGTDESDNQKQDMTSQSREETTPNGKTKATTHQATDL